MELARDETWRRYQIYLHCQRNVGLPPVFQNDQVKIHNETFARLLPENSDEEISPRFLAVKSDWMLGQRQEEGPRIWIDLYQHMNKSFDQVRNQILEGQMDDFRNQSADSDDIKDTAEEGGPPTIDLLKLPISSGQQFTATVAGDTITYTAPIGPLSVNPVVVAYFFVPYQRRVPGGEQTNYLINTAVISPGFPNKYLYGMFNILRDYFVYPE
jgi:hypothetical protein